MFQQRYLWSRCNKGEWCETGREDTGTAVSKGLSGVRADCAAKGGIDLPSMQEEDFLCNRDILYEVRKDAVT